MKIVIGNLFDIELPNAYFDGVFASNLLEHFHSPEEVGQFLDRMRTTLAPGGVLALMGPNFKYCARDYFDCADHLLALTHVSVQELLFAAGYNVTEVVPRFLPFSFRSRLPASPRSTRLYLRTPMLWRAPGQAVPHPRDAELSFAGASVRHEGVRVDASALTICAPTPSRWSVTSNAAPSSGADPRRTSAQPRLQRHFGDHTLVTGRDESELEHERRDRGDRGVGRDPARRTTGAATTSLR